MTDIERECVRRIAEAKSVPADSIALETMLESLAVDSLDRVSLSFDLEEQYGVEIPEHQLHTIRTVGDVAAAVQDALDRKQGTASTEAGAA